MRLGLGIGLLQGNTALVEGDLFFIFYNRKKKKKKREGKQHPLKFNRGP
jgi:hypothetical protein